MAIIGGMSYIFRKDEDGMYQLFKDVHQSNLDDIEKQELESQ